MSSKNNKLLSMSKLFRCFFQVGCFTIGGGFAMIPLIQREIVDNNCWMENDEFVDMLAVTQSAPGPVAVNAAVFVGFKLSGIKGAVTALLGTILPSFLIILLFAALVSSKGEHSTMQNFFEGVRPAIVALILGAGISLGQKSFSIKSDYALTFFALLLLLIFDIHPIILIIMGAISGIVRNYYLISTTKENNK